MGLISLGLTEIQVGAISEDGGEAKLTKRLARPTKTPVSWYRNRQM